jgi:hypothetical protein
MFSSVKEKAAAATPAPKAAATPAPKAATPAPKAATPAPSGGLFGAAEEPAEKPKSDLFGGLPPEPEPAAEGGGGDLFPSSGGGGGGAGDGGGGLFASPAASASAPSEKGALFPDEPEEPAGGSPAMTGQRNENSVLFSLSNLQSLASGGGGPATPSAPAAAAGGGGGGGGGAKPGYATAKGGGSGLVDIRAMAAATSTGDKKDDGDEGFSFASPSVAAPLSAAPVLMPVADSGRPKWLIPAIVGGLVLLIAVVVLLVIVLTKKPEPKPTSKTASAAMDTDGMGSDTMSAAGMSTDAMGGDAMTAMGTDAMTAMGTDAMTAMGADAMDAMDAMGSDSMAVSSRRRRRRRGSYSSRGMSSSSSRRSMSSGMTTMARSMARAMSSGGSSLQDLLRRAGGMGGSMSGGMAASNLPKRLSPSQIRKGVYRILGSARACFNRYRVPGRANVRVTVSGSSGRVSSAKVRGAFKGTPTGRCVARAFKRARFKKFASGSQSFTFPLIFR